MEQESEIRKTDKQLVSVLNTLNSNISSLIRNTDKSRFPAKDQATVNGKSVYEKQEDPAKDYYKRSLGSFKELIGAVKKINLTKASMGLGSLLIGGGILGYLLTGKKELLGASIKGFEKIFILPITKIVDKMIMTASDVMLKFGSKFLKNGAKLMTAPLKVAKSLLSGIGKKGLKIGEEGAKIGEEGLKIAGKAGEKVGIKALMKGGTKLGLKALAKIPFLGVVLGPVVGWMFAMERWKKGDKIGALGELASGIATMIPGAGIFLSLAIDGLLAVRDIFGNKKTDDFIGKSIKSPENKKNKVFNLAGSIIGAILSPIKSIISANKKFKAGDWWGALGDMAMLPFAGIGAGYEVLKSLKDMFSNDEMSDAGSSPTPTTSPAKKEGFLKKAKEMFHNAVFPPASNQPKAAVPATSNDMLSGNPAQRNNNPANIIWNPTGFNKALDKAGIKYSMDERVNKEGNHFLKFNSVSDGDIAAMMLLKDPFYQTKTFDEAMKKWSNKHFDIKSQKMVGYGAEVSPIYAKDANRLMKTFSDADLMQIREDMKKREGFYNPINKSNSNINKGAIKSAPVSLANPVTPVAQVINTNAMNQEDYSSTMAKIDSGANYSSDDWQKVVDAVREGANQTQNAILGIKMSNNQSVTISSVG